MEKKTKQKNFMLKVNEQLMLTNNTAHELFI